MFLSVFFCSSFSEARFRLVCLFFQVNFNFYTQKTKRSHSGHSAPLSLTPSKLDFCLCLECAMLFPIHFRVSTWAIPSLLTLNLTPLCHWCPVHLSGLGLNCCCSKKPFLELPEWVSLPKHAVPLIIIKAHDSEFSIRQQVNKSTRQGSWLSSWVLYP